MSKVIVTDMDDVLVDLLPCWVNTLNSRYGLTVSVEDINEWDMTKHFPTLCSKQIFEVLGEVDFWSSVTPKEGSVEGLKKLIDAGYTVYVCTATHYKNLKVKLDNCLLKHFSYLTYKDIIMSHNKQMISCDYIIDDYPQNIVNHKALSFLMDAPHNRNCKESHYNFRITSMMEVYDIIKKLENLENE